MSIDGSGTERARCVLAPNPSPMTLDGTNTWVIAEPGSTAALVVDPGPQDEGHLRRVLDAARAGDRRVALIVLTHGHHDHSAGAARFAAMTGAPVMALDPAHRLGSAGLAAGDVLTAAGCELRVVGTPGHSADSVSLLLEADSALLTGDTVLGRGTTVIGQDGALADYLRTLGDEIRAAGGRVIEIPGDVGNLAQITAGFATIRKELGDPEVLLYNAGAGTWGNITEITAEQYEATWRVNGFGAFICAKEVAPAMIARGHGVMLFTGATAGVKAGPRSAAFGPAKLKSI